jgi:hypothetical protein
MDLIGVRVFRFFKLSKVRFDVIGKTEWERFVFKRLVFKSVEGREKGVGMGGNGGGSGINGISTGVV